MAKPVRVFHWNLAARLFTVDDFGWFRIPDFNFFGFTGDMTISRVRCTYRMSYFLDREFDSDLVSDTLIMALAVTTGDPPLIPTFAPTTLPGDDSLIYRELPLGEITSIGPTVMTSPKGEVDALGQRAIPPGPEAAAVWFGVQAFNLSSVGGNSDVIIFATGLIIELGDPTAPA